MNNKDINTICWWIPFRKLRNAIRNILEAYFVELNDTKGAMRSSILNLNNSIKQIENSNSNSNLNLNNSIKQIENSNLNLNNSIGKILLYANLYKDKKKIYYLNTPSYGNLGDQAIALASIDILKEIFCDYEILDFYTGDWSIAKDLMIKMINTDDIIFLPGGGNLGNLYLECEEIIRREMVQLFPDNKIISMPQSITFTDDEEGREQLNISKDVYNANVNLTIMVRGETSYNVSKKYFQNVNTILAPDAVFYWGEKYHQQFKNIERKDVLFVMRNDKEKIMDDTIIEQMKFKCQELGMCYSNIEMNNAIDYIPFYSREERVEIVLKQFASSKLVITDRLHGMIFSFITNTPCIVFKSFDDKIAEARYCIEDVSFIHYDPPMDEIYSLLIKYGNNNETIEYDYSSLSKKILDIYREMFNGVAVK